VQTKFIGLASWIIQDGNYGDFSVGEEVRFALEFYPYGISPTAAGITEMTRQRSCLYRCQARYAFLHKRVCVLDFGLLAYRELRAPMEARLNDWAEVEIYLGIDPFFYSESLCDIWGMPPLAYDWRIERIWLETTPWLESRNELGQATLTRDEGREAFCEVSQTNGWTDDSGRAHYLLECKHIGGPHR
jgi:hypothetical protein